MTNLSIASRDEVSENQVIRSRVAKTQQPDAERLNTVLATFWGRSELFKNKRVSSQTQNLKIFN